MTSRLRLVYRDANGDENEHELNAGKGETVADAVHSTATRQVPEDGYLIAVEDADTGETIL